MESIGIWVGTIVTFLLGYAIGKGTINSETLTEAKTYLSRRVNQTRPGTFKRPSATDIERRKDPKKAEEDQAMKETIARLLEEE